MFENDSILPPNQSAIVVALEHGVRASKPDLTPIATLMDPNRCPAHLLGWLAWAFSVDTWDIDAPEEIKREVIRQSIEVHRRKGTVGAVKRALAATGVPAEIIEWWQDGAVPHTFNIEVDVTALVDRGSALDAALLTRLRSAVDAVKPVRSHFDITASYGVNCAPRIGGASFTTVTVEVYPT